MLRLASVGQKELKCEKAVESAHTGLHPTTTKQNSIKSLVLRLLSEQKLLDFQTESTSKRPWNF